MSFNCYTCGKKYTKASDFRRHVMQNHEPLKLTSSISNEEDQAQQFHFHVRPFICDFPGCLSAFQSNANLQQHHRKTHVTSFATREIRDLVDWSEDEEIVTQKMSYKCGSCNIGFLSKSALKKHETRLHPNAKYNCDLCAQRFEIKSSISCHIVNVHILNRPDKKLVMTKLYKCGPCKKVFSSKPGLQSHKQDTHLAIYEFVCTSCLAPFRDKINYDEHVFKYHTGRVGQNLKCIPCKRKFLTKYSLDKHEIVCPTNQQGTFKQIPKKTYKRVKVSDSSMILQNIIKQEPEEYVEQLQDFTSVHIKQEPIDADPFDVSHIKQENDDEDPMPFIKQEPECNLTVDEWFDTNEASTSAAVKEELMKDAPVKRTVLVTKIKCKLCDLRFNHKVEFAEHFKTHKRGLKAVQILPPNAKIVRKFQCKTCDEIFDSIEAVKRHNIVAHAQLSKEQAVIFHCKSCNKYRKGHQCKKKCQQTTSKLRPDIKCNKCQQLFRCKDELQKHMALRHVANKVPDDGRIRYHCSNCPKVFDRGWLLQEHFRIDHRGEKEDKDETSTTVKQEADDDPLAINIDSIKREVFDMTESTAMKEEKKRQLNRERQRRWRERRNKESD